VKPVCPFFMGVFSIMSKKSQSWKSIEPSRISAVILAAGLGKRMKSNKAKVLHEILGIPMVMYVIHAAKEITGENVICVVGNQAEEVKKTVSARAQIFFVLQERQLGTGHAVLSVIPHLPKETEEVMILSGDVPLLSVATLRALVEDHRTFDRDLTILGARLENPTGYGRILYDADRNVTAIVEEADAQDDQKRINVINAGTYCVKRIFLADALKQLRPDNAQGEFYLTDIIGIGYRAKKKIGVVIGDDPTEVLGVNTPEDLDRVEAILKASNRKSVDFI